MDSTLLINIYHSKLLIRIFFIMGCFVALAIIAGISVTVGQDISFVESYEIIINHIKGVTYPVRSEEWWKDYFIWKYVMPRIVVGIIAGCGLAVGGTIMQSVMSNPLADPYTTGISSGAGFGAVAAIIAGVTFSGIGSTYGIVTNAFIGSLIPAFIVILLSNRISSSPATMILIGTAISYFFNSAITLMMVTADADSLQAAYLWQVGSLTGMTWEDTHVMLFVTVIGSIIALIFSNSLNLLTIGENSAKSLGLDVNQFRILCLLLLSIMTAAIVSFTGTLGFVGLVAPHITRLVVGSDNRILIPASMVVGAVMLTGCDLISRVISNISDIPVGVVLSLLCSPIFLLLIIGRKSGKGVY